MFSALSVSLLYNASPGEFLAELRGSVVIEQEMARRLHSDLGFVARRRPVKTENPSACETVNSK
jgi:hypothetical protein